MQKNNEHKQNKFQPWINPVTEALVQNKRAAEGGESFLEKVQRLHHADKQKAEAVKTALQVSTTPYNTTTPLIYMMH